MWKSGKTTNTRIVIGGLFAHPKQTVVLVNLYACQGKGLMFAVEERCIGGSF